MTTNTISAGVDKGTQADLERLAILKWCGMVMAVVGVAVSFLAILGGILWHLAVAQTELKVAQAERASIMETLASINKTVTENTADIKAIRTTVESNSAGIKASSGGIAENRATIALVLKTMEENRKVLVLLRGDIASLKRIQEEFGRRQRLLLARHLEFSGKLEEFRDRLAALAETRARDAVETSSAAARMRDIEALVVVLRGRVKRLEDWILVSDDGAAAPSGGE